jgi:hypothetical protein
MPYYPVSPLAYGSAPAYRPAYAPQAAYSAPYQAPAPTPPPLVAGYYGPVQPAQFNPAPPAPFPPHCPAPEIKPPAQAEQPPAKKAEEAAAKQPEPQPAEAPAELPAPDFGAPGPQAAVSGGEGFAAPQMIGDLLGYAASRRISTVSGPAVARLPVVSFGSFKIGENESPRPQCRVFGSYNFFSNVFPALNPAPVPSFDIHRQTQGFEWAFFGGCASVGLRVPIVYTTGNASLQNQEFGDLSVILKYALVNDCVNGYVLSTGLVVTAPTGEDFDTVEGYRVDATLLQPFLGYLIDRDRIYIHGFTSVVVPTEFRVPTVILSDLGVGFWLYRSNCKKLITGIVPTVEGHANIPVSHRGADEFKVGFPDEGVITGGLHVIFFRKAILTLGASVPVTGPQPYDIEATAQLNVRF